jgi:outer membrane protein TolC
MVNRWIVFGPKALVLYCGFLIFSWTPIMSQTALTLEHALEIAKFNSPDVKRSELNLERRRELLNAQNAGLKSNFSLSLTPLDYNQDRSFNQFFSIWNTSDTKMSLGTFTISQPIKWTDGTLALINRFSWQDSYSEYQDQRSKTFSNNLYLSLEQPLFTYNRTKLALSRLELELEDAELNYAIQLLKLEKDVAQTFYAVYANRMSLQIAMEELENREQSYQIIKNKVEAGIAAKEEFFQAELDRASSKSNVQNQQVILDNSLDAFKKLIGISLFDEISVMEDVSHHPVEVDIEKALDHGLKNRMELRQRKIEIENALFNMVETSARNEFKGSITASYGIIGTDEEFRDVYEVPTKNQRFSLSFQVPLWDWGEKKSRIKASEASIRTSELSLEDQKNDIIIGVRSVYRNLKNLINQIELARQNVKNAQLTYDINLERYKNGDLTSMDLNLFQNQLSGKKLSLISALIDYKIELLNMKIQSLWDFEKNQPVVPVVEKTE